MAVRHHLESHRVSRVGWLRASVLGANDGVISTASLVVGVAAAGDHRQVLIAGLAGLVAGAMSMAAGEYVSVSSQADAERADLAREGRELKESPAAEEDELAEIYVSRGLAPALARQVARDLMVKDALGVHAREELGISSLVQARPVQAALASAASFAMGAVVPMLLAWLAPARWTSLSVILGSLACLAGLGAVGAGLGGANLWKAALRVTFWGALAMGMTALIGRLFGAVV